MADFSALPQELREIIFGHLTFPDLFSCARYADRQVVAREAQAAGPAASSLIALARCMPALWGAPKAI